MLCQNFSRHGAPAAHGAHALAEPLQERIEIARRGIARLFTTDHEFSLDSHIMQKTTEEGRVMSQEPSVRRPYNAVADFVDANIARGLGGKVAFADPTGTLTYSALQEATCR